MKGIAAAALAVPFVLVLIIGAGIYSFNPVTPTTADEHRSPGAAPAAVAPEGAVEAAAPFAGTSNGCTQPDPTNSDGCLTPAVAWLYDQLERHFGHQPTSCWDAHAWNPGSDHPRGKACDVTIGTAGRFPDDADRAHGWQVASWLRDNANALDVAYVIWDGKIWSASRADAGWRTYTGGGVYDASTPTGGHYDHVHVSTLG